MLERSVYISLAGAIGALAALVVLAGSVSSDDARPRPNHGLSPAEAVRAQVNALARNDHPFTDAGIEASWAFASPSNRAVTGPMPRFRTLFEGPVYGPMVDHIEARYSDPRQLGDRALVGVVVTDAGGEERGYLFELSRQGGGNCRGCWLTDSVFPMETRPSDTSVSNRPSI
ncbi:MAG: DUF4864 domain-containing protein [Pseudomonadota bacterium]|nr:DUF4864 domain-containing protein [Pseudomonadota bacterium]